MSDEGWAIILDIKIGVSDWRYRSRSAGACAACRSNHKYIRPINLNSYKVSLAHCESGLDIITIPKIIVEVTP